LESQADVNFMDVIGRTPLDEAVIAENIELAKSLIEDRVEKELVDSKGMAHGIMP